MIFDKIPSSFRDPSGFVFKLNNKIYRQVNYSYKENYDLLISSGLYEYLTKKELLIKHSEVTEQIEITDPNVHKIIEPEPITFISYPYEWCFEQLKDASLLTLQIQKIALSYGMTLKDASAYNIQFLRGKPIFIDSLSFEIYQNNEPWFAYRQFCEHFLNPLCLMCYTDIRLYQLLKCYIDGIPLNLTSKLLPLRSYFSISILAHIHIHAFSQKYHGERKVNTQPKLPPNGLNNLIENLTRTTTKLEIKVQKTEWANYYSFTNYTAQTAQKKNEIISSFLDLTQPSSVWDIGANTGVYSRIASDKNIETISFDIDEIAVNINYKKTKSNYEKNVLPLILNIANPSPNLGWANEERDNLKERGPADLLMALALIHHLSISNNITFSQVANYFSGLSDWLIIEFIPKTDSQVVKLLSSRKDIYSNYSIELFEKEFKNYFEIIDCVPIEESERTLYLMKVKN